MGRLGVDSDRGSGSITLIMGMCMKGCGGRIRDMGRACITIKTVRCTVETTSLDNVKDSVHLTIKMVIGMKVNGAMEILMGLGIITTLLERCTWVSIKTISVTAEADISIKTE